jgi:hypothetical protein
MSPALESCGQIAARVVDLDVRDDLLKTATIWLRLAQSREHESLARQCNLDLLSWEIRTRLPSAMT